MDKRVQKIADEVSNHLQRLAVSWDKHDASSHPEMAAAYKQCAKQLRQRAEYIQQEFGRHRVLSSLESLMQTVGIEPEKIRAVVDNIRDGDIDEAWNNMRDRVDRAIKTADINSILADESELHCFSLLVRRLAANTISQNDLRMIEAMMRGELPSFVDVRSPTSEKDACRDFHDYVPPVSVSVPDSPA